ncbi:MAG: hypothetical protein L3J93_01430 [Thermoplasmata archaeon]|nr:hypothetical protein [Thermoplasmata archaeon]
MPGAPNRPPETAATAPTPPPKELVLERKVLRRLGPSRIALRLDLWKGSPSRELVDPLLRAEEKYAKGENRDADSALDQLSVRFAEPRWPSLPIPFRNLRVSIPQPQPPHYDPENALPPAERDARKAHRDAELQLALARASLEWAGGHAVDVADLLPHLAASATAFASEGASETFWSGIDAVWIALRERVPMPTASGAPRAVPAPEASAAVDAVAGDP